MQPSCGRHIRRSNKSINLILKLGRSWFAQVVEYVKTGCGWCGHYPYVILSVKIPVTIAFTAIHSVTKLGNIFQKHIPTTVHLFDFLVKPILLYASDFWGCLKLSKSNPLETLHLRFRKNYLVFKPKLQT